MVGDIYHRNAIEAQLNKFKLNRHKIKYLSLQAIYYGQKLKTRHFIKDALIDIYN